MLRFSGPNKLIYQEIVEIDTESFLWSMSCLIKSHWNILHPYFIFNRMDSSSYSFIKSKGYKIVTQYLTRNFFSVKSLCKIFSNSFIVGCRVIHMNINFAINVFSWYAWCCFQKSKISCYGVSCVVPGLWCNGQCW